MATNEFVSNDGELGRARKRTCKFGKTKAGKCRKTPKRKGRRGCSFGRSRTTGKCKPRTSKYGTQRGPLRPR
jgi:hypothetical protein